MSFLKITLSQKDLNEFMSRINNNSFNLTFTMACSQKPTFWMLRFILQSREVYLAIFRENPQWVILYCIIPASIQSQYLIQSPWASISVYGEYVLIKLILRNKPPPLDVDSGLDATVKNGYLRPTIVQLVFPDIYFIIINKQIPLWTP